MDLVFVMVLILDSNSEIGAKVRSIFGHLICLRHCLDRQRYKSDFFFREISISRISCGTCIELPSI